MAFKFFTNISLDMRAYQLLKNTERFSVMSMKDKQEWAACIPSWKKKLVDAKSSISNRSWFLNICRHGESFTDDKQFWVLFLQRLKKVDAVDLSIALSNAALFNNVKPFQYWEEANLNVEVAPDVKTAFNLSVLTRGVHPGLPLKLRKAGFDISDLSALLSFFPKVLQEMVSQKGCYWDGYHSEGLTIEHISSMYVEASKLNEFEEVHALNWLGEAFKRVVKNFSIDPAAWKVFEDIARPHFEKTVDWDLLGACYGYMPEKLPNGQIQAALAYVGVTQHVEDPVQFGLLMLVEPKSPSDIYCTLRGIAKIEPEALYQVDSLMAGP